MRMLAVAATIVNTLCMVLAAVTGDAVVLTVSWVFAGVAGFC